MKNVHASWSDRTGLNCSGVFNINLQVLLALISMLSIGSKKFSFLIAQ